MSETTAEREQLVQAVIRDPDVLEVVDGVLEDHDIRKSEFVRFAIAEFSARVALDYVDADRLDTAAGVADDDWRECPGCGLTFPGDRSFQAHREFTGCREEYVCEDCGATFDSGSALGGHREMHSD